MLSRVTLPWGQTVYPGANPGLHMVALKRQPDNSSPDAPVLIPGGDKVFTEPSAAKQFLQNVLAGTPDALLIANGVGNYGFALNSIANNLEQRPKQGRGAAA